MEISFTCFWHKKSLYKKTLFKITDSPKKKPSRKPKNFRNSDFFWIFYSYIEAAFSMWMVLKEIESVKMTMENWKTYFFLTAQNLKNFLRAQNLKLYEKITFIKRRVSTILWSFSSYNWNVSFKKCYFLPNNL